MKSLSGRMLALLLALLCVAPLLVSCLKKEDDGYAYLVEEGSSSYVIVASSADRVGWSAANYLSRELQELTGVKIEVTNDLTEADSSIPEIRVGKTNRGTDYQLQRALRTDEYIISREGKDIYILGMGAGVLNRACDAFLSDVLDENFAVTGEGEIKRESGTYTVSSVEVNGHPVTEYTVLTSSARGATVDWSYGLTLAINELTAVSGHIMPTGTYDPDADELPCSPAIVLCPEPSGLAMTEYKVEVKGEDIYVTAGATAAALRILELFVSEKISPAGGELSLTVAGKSGDTGMSSAVFSVMSFNVLGLNDADQRWDGITDRRPYLVETILAAMPDFVCTQEYYDFANTTVTPALEDAGYGKLGGMFTEVSPTALEHATDDPNYQDYAQVGKTCYTPIFYRADLWELVEEDTGAYLFYWKNRYQYSNTKSMTYGVFRSKIDGALVFVVSTHFPLMTSSYTEKPEYADATDAVQGRLWREGATAEILKAVNAMRAKYPGILTVVAGDMNAKATETSMQTMVGDATILEDAYDLAPESARSEGQSYHGRNSNPPGATALPIDHVFVSDDTAAILKHQIIQDETALKSSDHCPVLAEIYRK